MFTRHPRLSMYTGHMTTTRTPEFAPAMARCTRKGCRFVARFDTPVARDYTHDRFGNERLSAVYADYRSPLYDAPQCPDHGLVQVHLVKGTVTDTKCDSRCTSAKGHVCECACGGANHGTDH